VIESGGKHFRRFSLSAFYPWNSRFNIELLLGTVRTSSRNGSAAASSSQVTVLFPAIVVNNAHVNVRRSGWGVGAVSVWGRLKKQAESTSPSIRVANGARQVGSVESDWEGAKAGETPAASQSEAHV